MKCFYQKKKTDIFKHLSKYLLIWIWNLVFSKTIKRFFDINKYERSNSENKKIKKESSYSYKVYNELVVSGGDNQVLLQLKKI